jgi:hypothetical protein
VGFFDDLRLPRTEHDDAEDSTPEWWAAPEDHVAGVVPVELVLARNDEAAVFVTRIAAYPQGFELEANVVTRTPRHFRGDYFDLMYEAGTPEGEIPPELLRLGVEFSDGRRASSLGEMLDGSSTALTAVAGDEEPPDPERDVFMTPGGGGGSARRSTQSYWIWPLPPPGLLTFVCEWPAFDIAETAVELDAETIREASRRARPVWS